MDSNVDRKERTVYVTGMHRDVNEDVIYDLFEKVGLVEKVVMHENDEGEPHHALVVFKHPESVMIAISCYNGFRINDQCLNMRPLRESSHAAVFQVQGERVGPSRMSHRMMHSPASLNSPVKGTQACSPDGKKVTSPRPIVRRNREHEAVDRVVSNDVRMEQGGLIGLQIHHKQHMDSSPAEYDHSRYGGPVPEMAYMDPAGFVSPQTNWQNRIPMDGMGTMWGPFGAAPFLSSPIIPNQQFPSLIPGSSRILPPPPPPIFSENNLPHHA